MAEIILNNGDSAIVDREDADLAELKWSAFIGTHSVYVRHRRSTSKKKKPIFRDNEYLHRIVLSRMLGRPLERHEQVDHINQDTLDNRRENLRLATASQNCQNRRKPSTNTSGYKGVKRVSGKTRWLAQITVKGNRIVLGYFDTPEEAYEAYCKAAIKYHGEFARFK